MQISMKAIKEMTSDDAELSHIDNTERSRRDVTFYGNCSVGEAPQEITHKAIE